jgi:hypothetical protein
MTLRQWLQTTLLPFLALLFSRDFLNLGFIRALILSVRSYHCLEYLSDLLKFFLVPRFLEDTSSKMVLLVAKHRPTSLLSPHSLPNPTTPNPTILIFLCEDDHPLARTQSSRIQ